MENNLLSAPVIPSLSGTFVIRTRLALNPKMPKEPSSPSRSNARIERQCIQNETNRLKNKIGQRTTCVINNCPKKKVIQGLKTNLKS